MLTTIAADLTLLTAVIVGPPLLTTAEGPGHLSLRYHCPWSLPPLVTVTAPSVDIACKTTQAIETNTSSLTPMALEYHRIGGKELASLLSKCILWIALHFFFPHTRYVDRKVSCGVVPQSLVSRLFDCFKPAGRFQLGIPFSLSLHVEAAAFSSGYQHHYFFNCLLQSVQYLPTGVPWLLLFPLTLKYQADRHKTRSTAEGLIVKRHASTHPQQPQAVPGSDAYKHRPDPQYHCLPATLSIHQHPPVSQQHTCRNQTKLMPVCQNARWHPPESQPIRLRPRVSTVNKKIIPHGDPITQLFFFWYHADCLQHRNYGKTAIQSGFDVFLSLLFCEVQFKQTGVSQSAMTSNGAATLAQPRHDFDTHTPSIDHTSVSEHQHTATTTTTTTTTSSSVDDTQVDMKQLELEHAVVVIQSAMRGHMERGKVQSEKPTNNDNNSSNKKPSNTAAAASSDSHKCTNGRTDAQVEGGDGDGDGDAPGVLVIQSAYRGWKTRRQFAESKNQRASPRAVSASSTATSAVSSTTVSTTATTTTTTSSSTTKSSSAAAQQQGGGKVKANMNEGEASLVIQSAYRGHVDREQMRNEHAGKDGDAAGDAEAEVDYATLKIQSAWRGYSTRKGNSPERRGDGKGTQEERELELSHAILKIQSAFRGHQERVRFNNPSSSPSKPLLSTPRTASAARPPTRTNPSNSRSVTPISASSRPSGSGRTSSAGLGLMDEATAIIQSAFRGKKERQKSADEEDALIRIQSAFRGFSTRKTWSEKDSVTINGPSAVKTTTSPSPKPPAPASKPTTLQTSPRFPPKQLTQRESVSSSLRRSSLAHEDSLPDEAAVIDIQSAVRGYLVRNNIQVDNVNVQSKSLAFAQDKQQEEAIILIQSVFRGHQERVKYQHTADPEKSLILIQSTFRGHVEREQHKEERHSFYQNRGTPSPVSMEKGTVSIQSAFRAHNDRSAQQEKTDSAAEVIQAAARSFMCRKEEEEQDLREDCAAHIQGVVRGWQERSDVEREKEAMATQKKYEEMRNKQKQEMVSRQTGNQKVKSNGQKQEIAGRKRGNQAPRQRQGQPEKEPIKSSKAIHAHQQTQKISLPRMVPTSSTLHQNRTTEPYHFTTTVPRLARTRLMLTGKSEWLMTHTKHLAPLPGIDSPFNVIQELPPDPRSPRYRTDPEYRAKCDTMMRRRAEKLKQFPNSDFKFSAGF
ncbi:hypothetical protein Pelo_13389 [Pelomyxa schiedti]|nr:hypothetical protein Pelo_13389 [Pelomyxa schiedti]